MSQVAEFDRPSRVLVVEDDTSQRRTLCDILSGEGFDPLACEDAGTALEALRSEPFPVAILDERLPGMSGTELLDRMRQMGLSTRAIIHTAFGSFDSARDAVNYGAFAYVEKLSSPKELLRHVHRGSKAWIADKLEESQRRYETLAELSPVGIFHADARGRCTYVNERWCAIAGATANDALGDGWVRRLHPADRERVQREWIDAARRGALFRSEYRYLGSSDKPVWVLGQARPDRDRDGALTGFVGTITDITALRDAQETLHVTQFALDRSSEPVLWLDMRGRFTYVNDAACESLGYSREELLALSVPDINPAFTEEKLQSSLVKIAETETVTFESVHRRKNGEEFPVDITANYLRRDEREFVFVISHDISMRKRAEAALRDAAEKLEQRVAQRTEELTRAIDALRESEERFRQMAENVDEVYFLSDVVKKKMIYVSPAYERIWGRSQTSLYRRPHSFVDSVVAADIDRVNQSLRDQRDGKPTELEYRIRIADGTERHIHARTFPVVDTNGNVYRVAGVVRDITKQKRAEESALRRQFELERTARFHAVGEMAAALAHELNQPLAAMANYAQGGVRRVAAGTCTVADLAHPLEAISEQAGRAARIVRSLREFVKGGSNDRVSVDVNELVKEAARLTRAASAEAEVTIEIELAEHLPIARADPIQIEQVILNLMRNGIEAMAESRGSKSSLHVRTETRASEIVVTVRDHGPGLDPVGILRAFEPLYTTKPMGMGMGLPICRTITRRHGGRLWAVAAAGGGMAFHFSLPVEASESL